MNQTSIFDSSSIKIDSFDDIDEILTQVYEEEKDKGFSSYNDTINGRSYYFYGTKVFEFTPKKSEKTHGRLKVSPEVMKELGGDADTYTSLSVTTETELQAFISGLQSLKRRLFRSIVIETFGCCNDFLRCSDAGHCIHTEDRFFNGCVYRTNLEQGRIFYGPKRNVDSGRA